MLDLCLTFFDWTRPHCISRHIPPHFQYTNPHPMVTKPRRAQGVHAAGNYISLSLRLKPGADGADAGEALLNKHLVGGLEHEFYFPQELGWWSNLTNSYFFRGVETTNQTFFMVNQCLTLVLWNHGILWLSIQLGMSSSQLTTDYIGKNHPNWLSYFQRGRSTTNQNV